MLLGPENVRQLFRISLTVPQYFAQKTWTDGLLPMHRNYCGPSVSVSKEMVTSSDSRDGESHLLQCGDQFPAGDPRNSAHAAIVTR